MSATNDSRVEPGSYEPSPPRPRVLVAEDDAAMRALIVELLERDGYEVAEVGTGGAMLDLLAGEGARASPRSAFDLIVTDIRMPGRGGLDVVAAVRRAGSSMPVIAITAFPDDVTRSRAAMLDAMLLAKPYALEALRGAVQYCLALR